MSSSRRSAGSVRSARKGPSAPHSPGRRRGVLGTRGVCHGLVAALLVAPLVTGVAGPGAIPAGGCGHAGAQPPDQDSCGVDVTLVLDASGSVSSSNAVEDVRDAAEALLDSLSNTNSTARVTQFATLSEQLAPRRWWTMPRWPTRRAPGGDQRLLRPETSPPPGTTIYRYDGSGNPLSSGNYREDNGSIQYTNWDQSLDQAADTTPELVVYVTDGDPTAFDFNKPGDPFTRPAADVAVGTDGGNDAARSPSTGPWRRPTRSRPTAAGCWRSASAAR